METTLEKKTNIVSVAARVYLWLMLLGLPLVVHDGYFDITETKTVWFTGWTVLFLLFRGVMALQYGEKPSRLRTGELCALVLAVVALLASLMSGFFWESFLGTRGRWQGAGMIWLYAALFLAFPGGELRKKDVLIPLTGGLALSGLTAVVQHLGFDVLGFSAGLIDTDKGRYISTLGNINFAGAYLALVIPTILWELLQEERPLRRLLWGALSLLGLWAAMAVRSECTVLGLGAALALLPFLLKKSAGAIPRWGLLWPGLAAGMQLYGFAAHIRGGYLSSLTRLLLHPRVSVAMAAFGILWWLLLRKREGEDIRKALRIYGFLLLAASAATAIGLTLLNTVWKDVPLGSMELWLRFSDSWGTDRGKVWAYCLGLYREFPLPEKLLGGGCGILAELDMRHRIFPDAILDAAHSEYIQLLLNWGLVGLLSWLGWLAFTARDVLRRGDGLSLALLAGLLGYAVQAAVNIAQTPGIAMFFVLLAAAGRRESSFSGKTLE